MTVRDAPSLTRPTQAAVDDDDSNWSMMGSLLLTDLQYPTTSTTTTATTRENGAADAADAFAAAAIFATSASTASTALAAAVLANLH